MDHECPKNGCVKRVRKDMLACSQHWFQVSKKTRDWVWLTYLSGRDEEHQQAVAAAIEEMNA